MNAATLQPAQGAWRHPFRALRGTFQRWLYSRLPRTDTLTLTQRNVYIVPTRAGGMLALTLLLLLVASINFQLNLGHLLTFFLAGSAVVGMHLCHGNLRGLTLHLMPPAPVHAGQAVALDIHLTSERKTPRYGIGLGLGVSDPALRRDDSALAWTDVPAQGSALVRVAWVAPRRGQHPAPPLTAVTLFPLGSFRVWTVWRPAAQVLVYPAPEAHPPPLPPGEPLAGPSGGARAASTGEFDGVRAYRRGDPQKAVV